MFSFAQNYNNMNELFPIYKRLCMMNLCSQDTPNANRSESLFEVYNHLFGPNNNEF